MILKKVSQSYLIASVFLLSASFSLQAFAQTPPPPPELKKFKTTPASDTQKKSAPLSPAPAAQPVVAPPASTSPWTLGLNLGISLEQVNDSAKNNTLSSLYAIPVISYSVSDTVSLNFNGLIYFENGSYQASGKPPTEPTQNFIRMRNATLDLKPSPYFNLAAGIVGQRAMHSNLFISTRGFPGVRVSSELVKSDPFTLSLRLQQTIVTSVSQTTNTKPGEETPSLFSGGFLQSTKVGGFTSSWSLNYFEFKNLPGSLADSSKSNGSLVNSTGPADKLVYSFVNRFLGYDTMLALGYEFNPTFKYSFTGKYVYNQAAPQDVNDGYILTNELTYTAKKDLALIPTYEIYQIEPDAAVSGLNDGVFNTNRTGYIAGLRIKYKNLTSSFRAGEREATYLSANQLTEKVYKIEFETDSIKF